ncbi:MULTISPECIES: hypothetical protein [Chromobacterium]|uniref:hypothetical protein n=1 Tax=Chromobacterium TaxID=535 RepID=UPI0003141935|nr:MULTISPECIES: hypothetical protein [Chromobacterium]QOD84885.1 hypothetical protein IEZ30_10560 [Chromobacterium haemolyticum]
MKTAADYGITIKPRGEVYRPRQMDLDTPEGSAALMASARRVIRRHRAVIKALAKR